MSTLRQYISQLNEALQINNDDSTFDTRYLIDLIEQQFQVDKRNEYNRTRSFDDTVFQIYCVDMEIVDASACCGEVLTDCKILRSVSKIPDTIELHHADGIQSIRTSGIINKPVNYINVEKIPFIGHDEITNKLLYAFMWNGYLYLYSKNSKYLLIDKTVIRAMFAKPYTVGQLECEDDCFTLDSPYPASDWMWQTLTKPNVLKELMLKQSNQIDTDNDAKDSKEDLDNMMRQNNGRERN